MINVYISRRLTARREETDDPPLSREAEISRVFTSARARDRQSPIRKDSRDDLAYSEDSLGLAWVEVRVHGSALARER